MDCELKQKWLTALRSGQYEQGQGRLRTSDNRFCCLGVLCDVINSEKWALNVGGAYDYIHGYQINAAVPPLTLHSEIGLSRDQSSTLIQMNDEGKPFSVIADYIEANV